jgi:hypothetical protein
MEWNLAPPSSTQQGPSCKGSKGKGARGRDDGAVRLMLHLMFFVGLVAVTVKFIWKFIGFQA